MTQTGSRVFTGKLPNDRAFKVMAIALSRETRRFNKASAVPSGFRNLNPLAHS
ncbi:MAG TPA: hypothetical protein V6D27_06845 [Vampirovibrionales bacterium]